MSRPGSVCHTFGTLHHYESQTLVMPDTPSSSLTPQGSRTLSPEVSSSVTKKSMKSVENSSWFPRNKTRHALSLRLAPWRGTYTVHSLPHSAFLNPCLPWAGKRDKTRSCLPKAHLQQEQQVLENDHMRAQLTLPRVWEGLQRIEGRKKKP